MSCLMRNDACDMDGGDLPGSGGKRTARKARKMSAEHMAAEEKGEALEENLENGKISKENGCSLEVELSRELWL